MSHERSLRLAVDDRTGTTRSVSGGLWTAQAHRWDVHTLTSRSDANCHFESITAPERWGKTRGGGTECRSHDEIPLWCCDFEQRRSTMTSKFLGMRLGAIVIGAVLCLSVVPAAFATEAT